MAKNEKKPVYGFNGFRSLNDPIREKARLTTEVDFDTQGVLIQQAKTLVLNHQQNFDDTHARIIAKLATTDDQGKKIPIDGFHFSFTKDGVDNGLKELLSHDKTKGIYLSIAKYPGAPDAGYTLVMYAVNQECENGGLDLHLMDNKIFDFCDPCPPKKPTSLDVD